MRCHNPVVLAAVLVSLAAGSASAQEPQSPPNIVIIMADDMGYSDIGCYGGEIQTPNIDKLAKGGLRFTQFYNTGRCCPTRASLLTGLYPHQAGVGHMVSDRGHDGYRGELNRRCVTIAEVLQTANYSTYMSGKWHVTPVKDRANWPLQRGFDRYFGTIDGAGSFWTPHSLIYDNEPPKGYPDDFYYTDAISDHAVKFVQEHKSVNKPFFMYVAFTAPHWPLHARKRDIAKYDGVYEKGWDEIRKARHAHMIELGIVRKEWRCTPRDGKAKAWDTVDTERKKDLVRRMQIYAAQVDSMDQGIGRIVDALRKRGMLNNTLILFLADNGGCAEGGIWGFERKKGGELGTNSSFASYGLSWANASNTPFREYKHWVHEGGISTPLVAHWPSGIPARGEFRGAPGHLVDLMATCVDLSGAKYPTRYKGVDIQPVEGKSLVGVFHNIPLEREAIYWEHEGNRAVRVGQHKLVAKGARGPWELYDLAADRTELRDLSAEEPELTQKLATLWQRWAERCNVLPLNPRARLNPKDFSTKNYFELRQGDALSRKEAPFVAGRRVDITIPLDGTRSDGVLIAQGGGSNGYAVYLKDGKLQMATRHGGRLTLVATEKNALPAGAVRIRAMLALNGTITLHAGDRELARGKAPGAMRTMPIDGLQVGRDAKGPVGKYKGPFQFAGKIGPVTVRLGGK